MSEGTGDTGNTGGVDNTGDDVSLVDGNLPGATAQQSANGGGTNNNGDGGDGGGGTGSKVGGAPESYEAFKGPDGNPLPESRQTQLASVAKSLGLSQEQAQLYVDSVNGVLKSESESLGETFKQVQKEWVESAKADKEFGGEAFEENLKYVSAAMKEFATPELREVLKNSGLGNNPEVVRLLYRVGKALGQEDDHVAGDGGTGQQGDRLSRLYPSMVEKAS